MGGENKTRIAIVDDHPLFRQGLALVLQDSGLQVVAETGTPRELFERLAAVDFDLAIVDVLLPGESGISAVADLLRLHPRCHILGLSVVDDPGLIADMLRAGAHGYAVKTQSPGEIIDAIRQVLGGVCYLPPTVSHDAVDAALTGNGVRPIERLTRREREVFELVIRGFSNDEIALRLAISRRTAETHRQRINRKLSAHSIAELQRIAARYGGLGA